MTHETAVSIQIIVFIVALLLETDPVARAIIIAGCLIAYAVSMGTATIATGGIFLDKIRENEDEDGGELRAYV